MRTLRETPEASARPSCVKPRSIRRSRMRWPTSRRLRCHWTTRSGSFWPGRVGTLQVGVAKAFEVCPTSSTFRGWGDPSSVEGYGPRNSGRQPLSDAENRCPAGHENRTDQRFCGQCGAQLTVRSPTAGADQASSRLSEPVTVDSPHQSHPNRRAESDASAVPFIVRMWRESPINTAIGIGLAILLVIVAITMIVHYNSDEGRRARCIDEAGKSAPTDVAVMYCS